MDLLDREQRELLKTQFSSDLCLHEALSQEGGLGQIAAFIHERLGGELLLIQDQLRNFALQFDARRQRFIEQETARIVRPRLELESHPTFEQLSHSALVIQRKKHKSSLGRNLRAEGIDPAVQEEEERVRWAQVLVQYLVAAELPVVKMMEGTTIDARPWLRIFGSRRAKTLRNRAQAWKLYHNWLSLVRGRCWPRHISDILDYLEGRLQDGCGVSIPGNFIAALSLLENVGRVTAEEKFSHDVTIQEAVKSYEMDLQGKGVSRRHAMPLTVSIILSLELYVCDERKPNYGRFLAWVVLLMVWMTLRCDDVQWIDIGRMIFTSSGLKLIITRTKTTGPGHRAQEVPAFIERNCSLSGRDWLQNGWDLFQQDPFNWERSYFAPCPTKDWNGVKRKYLNPAELSLLFRALLGELEIPIRTDSPARWRADGRCMLDKQAVTFWTGHSPRHWLPTLAARLGFQKESRDFLGRWQAGAGEANAYILSAQQNVFAIQRAVVSGVCIGHKDLGEEEVLHDFKDYVANRGMSPSSSALRLTLLKQDAAGRWGLQYPPISFVHDEPDAIQDDHMFDTPVQEEEAMSSKCADGGFWVSVSRKTGFRRLHKMYGCGVMHWNVFKAEFFHNPKEAAADAWCKICRKSITKKEAESESETSTSGSSSSTTETEDIQG